MQSVHTATNFKLKLRNRPKVTPALGTVYLVRHRDFEAR